METERVSPAKRLELYAAIKCILVFSSIASVLVVASGFTESATIKFIFLFITGWLSWTFVEYFLHRFWMHNHFRNVNSKLYNLHMDHHKHPTEIKVNEYHRLVFFSFGIVLLYLAIIWNNYFTLFLGFYFGLIFYSLIHIMLHKSWGKYIFPKVQRAHIHHHGKHPDKGFSFSTIIWDWMFGTLPPSNEVIPEKMLHFYFKTDKKNLPKLRKVEY
jgi:sterol desaturase/sphingolipid hydroxylase (fatty acid hydroxylase superfamily)